MADITYRRNGMAVELIVNGVDLTNETYRDVELVEVGDEPEFSEVGLRITLVVSKLTLDTEEDIQVTDRLPVVAQQVRSITEAADRAAIAGQPA